MSRIWILVADNTRGRLFRQQPHQTLRECEVLLNPDARAKEQDLVSDGPGHGMNRARASRFAMQPRSSRKSGESERFARLLAQRLRFARRGGSMKHLYLVAEPSFLGKLHAHLDAGTRDCVRGQYAKNVSRLNAEAIRALLPQRL